MNAIERTMPSHMKGRLLIFFIVLIGVGSTLFRESLFALFAAVLDRQGSSHGIFVPFISGYLLWLKFDRIKKIKPQSDLLPGGAMLLIGLLLLFLGNSTKFSLYLSVVSFLCIAGALVLLLFGRTVFREIAFPLFFLAAMIPLPSAIYNQIAHWMREVNTSGSVTVTKAIGAPLYREGFNIYLPEVNLFVADSCSGIRYLLSYFTFSIVYAALCKQNNLARLFVILGSIPLAVVGGITRLSVVFLAAHYISPYWAKHSPHVFLSWVVFTVWLIVVIGVDQFVIRRRALRYEV